MVLHQVHQPPSDVRLVLLQVVAQHGQHLLRCVHALEPLRAELRQLPHVRQLRFGLRAELGLSQVGGQQRQQRRVLRGVSSNAAVQRLPDGLRYGFESGVQSLVHERVDLLREIGGIVEQLRGKSRHLLVLGRPAQEGILLDGCPDRARIVLCISHPAVIQVRHAAHKCIRLHGFAQGLEESHSSRHVRIYRLCILARRAGDFVE
mmetsp:Transcript_30186/g.86475  ORF Transcript_30186/g.86475 Transcript_30186/m.86475 type:complete len:205 (+) Transcript_30186:265-879(+)